MESFPKPYFKTNSVATMSIICAAVFSAPSQDFNHLMKEQMNRWKIIEWLDKWMKEEKVLGIDGTRRWIYQILSRKEMGWIKNISWNPCPDDTKGNLHFAEKPRLQLRRLGTGQAEWAQALCPDLSCYKKAQNVLT